MPNVRNLEEKTTLEPVHEKAKDSFIIDADFHLHVPIQNLFEYVEDDLVREKLENFGSPPVAFNWSTQYASGVKKRHSHERAFGVALTRDEIHEIMDQLCLNEAIVQPGTDLPFLGGTRYPEIKKALIQAYNEYVLEKVIDVDRGIYCTVMFPQWDGEAAVAELERVGDHPGFVAAQNYFGREELWGAPRFDTVYDKLTELNLPLFLHITGTGVLDPYSPAGQMQETNVEAVVGGIGGALMINVLSMIMTGVFDKYPDFNVCFQEIGTNWIPWVAYRADEQYQTTSEDVELVGRMRELDQKYLERLPSEYVFDNIYSATQPISLPNMPIEHQEAMLKACQADKSFMFTSDWPHITTDAPNWVFDNPKIDDETRERILYKNTHEIIRLPK